MVTINVQGGWNLENSYRTLPDEFFTFTNPTPVERPQLVAFNESLAEELGLNVEYLTSEKGVNILGGNELPPSVTPLAQAYAGHQFGYFTRLGDGRAVLLGEQITPENKRVDIQYKGSGPTVYSRGGDGRAALGPMLREYLISEAMHGLHIPTTRSLAVVLTGEDIVRGIKLPGALLVRVASSHIRVGTFQFAQALQDVDKLRQLADYTIQRHDPDVKESDAPYRAFLDRVVKRQARLVAKWQLVGFIHGVMNTDNMTISGETIDYGPCAFMNEYDPRTVFSSIDDHGRYRYENQPPIANWNLARFAETLLPLLDDEEQRAIEIAEEIIHSFPDYYMEYWLEGMRNKLGLFNVEEEDEDLIKRLLRWMDITKADYTDTFLYLTFKRSTIDDRRYVENEDFQTWYERWEKRLSRQKVTEKEINERMKQANPALIPRNHLVEEALEKAAENDFRFFERLIKELKNPFAHNEAQRNLARIPVPSTPYRTFCGT